MAFHYNCSFKIVYIGLIICSCLNCVLQSDVGLEPNVGFPFCGENNTSGRLKRLILISTLDGKLSALDMENGGAESWHISTGPGSMLSSSIHRLELSNNGQWVRMIPSLSGGLYKFNGEQIEAIPVTADSLLRASFKLPDDLVISGGKESRTYGVELESGRVLYECSMGGCENPPGRAADGHMLLVQRMTQTVRAVEPRTGAERWNFSVGQHDVKLQEPPGCLPLSDPGSSEVMLKVIVPEGLVCALDRSRPGHVLWTHKFAAPVVSAWSLGRGQPEPIDLFGGPQPALGLDNLPFPSTPLLYVGMHQKQLYIQESVLMQQKLYELSSHLTSDDRRLALPRIPWNPVLVSSVALGLPGPESETLPESSGEDSNQTTAMSVLYASEYVNGNGYYLYSEKEKNGTTLCPANKTQTNATDKANSTKSEVPTVESPDDLVFAPAQIFVYGSLWTWWKEVFLISITTAIVVNLLIQRRNIGGSPSQIIYVKESLQSNSSIDSGRESSTHSVDGMRSTESFESRFLTDFIPVHCLGKGGFGIVFEAKNKIDDCHYAIKRIPLPNSEESRERVMREVKALAKLDHQNIVRYFNAWLECPPPGWQESQDQAWKADRDAVSSACGDAFTVDLTGQLTPESERSAGPVVKRTLQPMALWQPPIEPLSCRPPIDDDDSYIVFGSPSREVSEAVFKRTNEFEGEKLDSAITVTSDTSADTETNITDVEKSNSPKRPNKLEIKCSSDMTSGSCINSSRMFLFIQMQLCKKKSLRDWLKDNIHHRPNPAVINIFDQIVQAVEYVHMQGLIHRDLKPSNIFFAPDGQIKVGDFGLVTAMAESPGDAWVSVEAELDSWGEANDRHTARVGTQLYMSPEQVSGKSYSYKVDIYSLGVILFELLVPFSTQMERIHTLTNLRANKYPEDFQAKYTQEYELLRLMLSPRPDERPTTYGIRGRPPLGCDSPLVPADWHFELPSRRRSSTSVSRTSKGSSDS